MSTKWLARGSYTVIRGIIHIIDVLFCMNPCIILPDQLRSCGPSPRRSAEPAEGSCAMARQNIDDSRRRVTLAGASVELATGEHTTAYSSFGCDGPSEDSRVIDSQARLGFSTSGLRRVHVGAGHLVARDPEEVPFGQLASYTSSTMGRCPWTSLGWLVEQKRN